MGTKRIILLAILFAALSTTITAQNVPTSVLWGNARIPLKSANGDTIGYTSLLDLRNQFFIATGGTMLGVSVTSANGLAGTSNGNSTNPALTLSTTVSGMVKANGTAFSAATVRTDYAEPTTALATGILKNTTGTGAHTIAVAADFPVLNQNTTGTSANVTGVVAIANGGSGASSQAAAITALTGTQTANYILASDGTNASLKAMTVAMLPTAIPNANLANSSFTTSLTATGTDVTVSGSPTSLGGTLTVNIPDASATARGVITTGGQTLAGAKTFSGAVTAGGNFTSTLTSTLSGGVVFGVATISSTSTLTAANNTVYADATSAAITLTLPTTPPDGYRVRLIKKNTTTNYVTIARGGTNTINGAANPVVLVSAGMPITLSFQGSDWVQE